MDTLYATAVSAQTTILLDRGLEVLQDENKLTELATLYSLLDRVGQVPALTLAWKGYIKRRGVELVSDAQRDATLIEDLLSFKVSALSSPCALHAHSSLA